MGPHLHVLLPRTGAVPINAAIVLEGWVGEPCRFAVQHGTDELAFTHEQLAAFTHDPIEQPLQYYLLRPASGWWPSGGTVRVIAERMGHVFAAFEVPIGTVLDTAAPVVDTIAAPELRSVESGPLLRDGTSQGRYDTVAIDHDAIHDVDSPIIIVDVWQQGERRTGVVREGVSGALTLPPELRARVDEVAVRDAAGNEARVQVK